MQHLLCAAKPLAAAASCGLWLAGCAAIPSLPDDTQFPVSEILRFTACELRDAYWDLSHRKDFPNFKADEYAISVELQPKSDTEVTGRAGLTGKSSLTKSIFNSWAVGASTAGGSPGAGYDTTGHQDGAVYFIVKSSDLLKHDKKRPLDCEHWSPAQHALTANLEVRKWLERSAASTSHPVGGFNVDKHTFLAEITIQWDIGGAFTYNFPLGTNYATGSGRYKIDEVLSITITHEEPKTVIKHLVTVPAGGNVEKKEFSHAVSGPSVISPDTKTRLDLLQLQQSLQNLQVNVPR
jgi:hypothetical protein